MLPTKPTRWRRPRRVQKKSAQRRVVDYNVSRSTSSRGAAPRADERPGVRVVPRTNNSQPPTPNRTRSRVPSRVTTESSGSSQQGALDAAADMSSLNAGASSETPTYDEIAEAAYQRYLQRGSVDGRDFDDWLEAERELKARRRAS